MDKKTIAHGYDNRTGGTILLKHAQYAINNERMLMARNSEIDLENVFKRMNDSKFSEMRWGERRSEIPDIIQWKNLRNCRRLAREP